MFNDCIFCFEGIISYCSEMGKRGGNDCYQPEKWAFLAEKAGNNTMFATTLPPSYGKTTGQKLSELKNKIKSRRY
jgi:hypothetical protein